MNKRFIFGEWIEANKALTVDEVNIICEKAEKHRLAIADYPISKVFEVLNQVKILWSKENSKYRLACLEKLPTITGFSREMVKIGLDELNFILDPDILEQKLKTEFKDIPRQFSYQYNYQTKTALQWQPLGVLLHVLAGNVFVGGVGSLIEGFLTGNVNILKLPSSEKFFLPLFIESLMEVDRDGVLTKSIALIDYESKQDDIINALKNRVDGIVVWGGEQAVKAYRNNLPARTKIIVFGPKLSLSVVTVKGLMAGSIELAANHLAEEIAIWDQNACTAPQVCYVEGVENARLLSQELASKLNEISAKLPAGEVDRDNAVEIRKIRNIYEIAEARSEGILLESNSGLDWTVFHSKDLSLEPSPLHRTLKIVAYTKIEEVYEQVNNLRGYVQTIGIFWSAEEISNLVSRFSRAGALRILPLAGMGGGQIDDPHDGAYDLPQLMQLVVSRHSAVNGERAPNDLYYSSQGKSLIEMRLHKLIETARKSTYYKPLLHNFVLNTVEDLTKLPLLTRDYLEANMPPTSNGLATNDKFKGGYVTRSGGSTGEPKYSIYDQEDWDNMLKEAVKIFQAMGLTSDDRVANCMMAGDLYGSFVSFDHISHLIGATLFSFSEKVKPEVLLDTWRKFDLSVVIGVPSLLIPLLRSVKLLDSNFTINKIIYAGSPLSPSDREWLKQELKVERIASVIGANDGCQFAFQCEHMEGRIHHTIDDYNYLEILDDNNQPVEKGEVGKIVITSLLKFAYPLIRYEIGDLARWRESPCPCGRGYRSFEYMGRTSESVTIGGINLKYSDLESSLVDFKISQMQLIADVKNGVDILKVRVETQQTIHDSLADEIYSTILQKLPIVNKIVSGKILDLKIEVLKNGGLTRDPRSGKIKNIIDERI